MEYDQANMLFERSLGIREKALGPDHPDVAETLVNRAESLVDQAQMSFLQVGAVRHFQLGYVVACVCWRCSLIHSDGWTGRGTFSAVVG